MIYFLLQAHSGWRWIVLVLIVITVIRALIGLLSKQNWTTLDKTLLLFSRVAVYIQVVLGIMLYILLQKWSLGMSFTGGHVFPALLAVVGVEFGAGRAKKSRGKKRFMFVFLGFVIALVLVYGALVTVGQNFI